MNIDKSKKIFWLPRLNPFDYSGHGESGTEVQ